MMGIDVLIIDKQARSGNAWRKRYHDLTLHDSKWVSAMPYLEYPPNWPVSSS
jgi:cation diffusion facilitator CzcD-associated flavoprotein CzcO